MAVRDLEHRLPAEPRPALPSAGTSKNSIEIGPLSVALAAPFPCSGTLG